MTADKTPDSDDERSGASSVADEAARLAQAFSVWAQRDRGAASPDVGGEAGSARTDPAECGCSHGDSVEAVCRMCPVCRAAGLLQAVQPELLDRVADLLNMVAGGLHSAAEQKRAGDPVDGPARGDV